MKEGCPVKVVLLKVGRKFSSRVKTFKKAYTLHFCIIGFTHIKKFSIFLYTKHLELAQ